jgi:endoglucanase
MHLTLALLIALSTSVVIEIPSAAQEAAPTPTVVQRHGKLTVMGNQILDEHNQPVILRGMSLFWSQWGGQFYNADCVKWLRDDFRCTVVRAAIGVGGNGYLRNPDAEMKKAETVMQAAIDNGIYVIVDWHAHDAQTAAAQRFFAHIAQKYGHHPNVIYETWNEPIRQDWSTVIKPYHEAVVASIRQHDPDNLVICGTQQWSQLVDKAAADPVKGTNIAYTLHFYAATHKQPLRDRAQAALDKGAALMVTEWGTSEATGNGKLDAEETQRWQDFMDEHHLSSCNWSVIDQRETSAALMPGAAATGGWTPEMLSPSGKRVREILRAKNAHGAPAPGRQ